MKKDGGASRDRTDDLKLAKLPLSQLSYGPDPYMASDTRVHSATTQHPIKAHKLMRSTLERVVGLGRFELPTSRLSSARSNQLSYRPLSVNPVRRKRNVGGRIPRYFKRSRRFQNRDLRYSKLSLYRLTRAPATMTCLSLERR